MSTKTATTSMAYPIYRNSGTPWIGKLPSHWEVGRLKQHVQEINHQTTDCPPGKAYVALENVESWTGRVKDTDNDTQFESQVKKFLAGDVLFGKLRPYLAKVTRPEYEGVCVGEFLVLRTDPKKSDARFVERLLRAKPVIDAVDASTFGARMPRANWQFIGNMEIPVPPLDEQASIVRYLEEADTKIQAYISAKERLIALLGEQRQAIIHQAVTRGMDPDAKLKPSGVEWLGDVPEHWEVRRIKTLAQAMIGLTYSPQEITEYPEGTLVLRASNIRDRKIVDADNVHVRCAVPKELILREGDILVCSRSGSRSLIGKNARIGPESAGSTFGAFMTILRGTNNGYLHQLLNSQLFEQQSGMFMTSTINQLTLGMINNMKVPIPPPKEQQRVLTYLHETTSQADVKISQARRQIELMEEYRTRLIADVVTGKLDVNDHVLNEGG